MDFEATDHPGGGRIHEHLKVIYPVFDSNSNNPAAVGLGMTIEGEIAIIGPGIPGVRVCSQLRQAPGGGARLPNPSGAPLRSVLVDGNVWSDFSGEEIRLPVGEWLEILARF